MRTILSLVVFVVILLWLTVGAAPAQSTSSTSWVDEISNSVAFYKVNYPTSNWEPYQQRLGTVHNALDRGDQRAVKTEMTKFFRMLQNREHGINDVAADELYNFAVMVTPLQEYGISLPAVPTTMP